MTPAPRLAPSPTAVTIQPPVDSRFYLATVAGTAWLAGIGLATLVNAGLGFWLLMACLLYTSRCV